ncbi:hypothetical protein COT97_01345 [Candidatus Falkowbacteria bacterium CG10_big_fil_rev_8_21_14_0_10_39_11]|uniref:Uncharacterized protein n=1 Tax=Candidatus Falkowbacteria bacterium CG10_big_fil_rev_8_21_14_0_10_39_11 TaxID=1974565 RepID=A0A2H0V7T9_9BACT|nr:MAG: hypothetical protein COT97_01345 [Candidatus Falkowbacteria bacterium CG10_big_fil_rev_8_21_14_0_10_39_11]
MISPTLDDIREFLDIVDEMIKIMKSKIASWETKYDLIFYGDTCIIAQIKLLEINFDYTTPDISFENDCRALYKAIKSKADELKKIAKALITANETKLEDS